MKKRTDDTKDSPARDQAMEDEIYDALIDKGWLIPQTEEEVFRAERALAQIECSPLPPEMDDPYRLFDRLEDDPGEELLLRALSSDEGRVAGAAAQSGDERLEVSGEAAAHASVLADLRRRTRLPATQIAVRMGVTVPFLSAVGRYPQVVPSGWRRELDARAERGLGTERGEVMRSFEHPYQAQMAASRDEAYEAERMTPERILDQSGMAEEERRAWLRLASED